MHQAAELRRQFVIVRLQVRLAPGYPGHDLLDMAQILIQLIRLLPHLDEPTIRLVHLGKRIHKAIGEIVKDAAPTGLRRRGLRIARGSQSHMRIPVRRLQENRQQRCPTEDRMQRQSPEKPMQRPRPSVGEFRPEPIPPHVLHLVLVRQRRHRAGRVFSIERLV